MLLTFNLKRETKTVNHSLCRLILLAVFYREEEGKNMEDKDLHHSFWHVHRKKESERARERKQIKLVEKEIHEDDWHELSVEKILSFWLSWSRVFLGAMLTWLMPSLPTTNENKAQKQSSEHANERLNVKVPERERDRAESKESLSCFWLDGEMRELEMYKESIQGQEDHTASSNSFWAWSITRWISFSPWFKRIIGLRRFSSSLMRFNRSRWICTRVWSCARSISPWRWFAGRSFSSIGIAIWPSDASRALFVDATYNGSRSEGVRRSFLWSFPLVSPGLSDFGRVRMSCQGFLRQRFMMNLTRKPIRPIRIRAAGMPAPSPMPHFAPDFMFVSLRRERSK